MMLAPPLLAMLDTPWNIVGLVVSILIALIPLAAVVIILTQIVERPGHKPLDALPGAKGDRKLLTSPTHEA